ncbi:MAG: L-lactate dehydrogenase [Microcystis panniformis Mp_MB_F_20051200_S9]|uniref:L-lactate dehydrogenase n=1 Tax=Microcystis panniformis Mp_MB_F_20051200_S9 TaxID=2486223 RepID=A0A552PJ82_9CHRO|nr:MAG: L-lactate dehydrogenase [Microcystis panniformis Mp_MB_F_20080800_S26D]TRV46798.1 MAG: L-lactate dehydrogenase [Microcystis panniformis Mp_GB_SS_20050300_S99D]TRV51700.1 MAG: L-lactate dehydrogenase [Microcystis panniformis Mp_GB_SS_20050300_S99]TRV57043.1 MAG: L-lactate dehydrogenase [Microcystis panniformis Mp_MB_F_20051200_S9]TRV57782.1 MAG: L-lactate dehydrogenase [Microcystis panniformis Mp_MB_F_20080800_S26]TRV65956.1 MAG: L-lactate dehydrogenase [Microcystis panniformis Mp_MB_F_
MLDKIFTPNPYAEKPAPLRPRKGVIIGVGQVGMACAYSMLIQDCFDELILQDIATDKVEGEVMDLRHGMPFIEPTDLKMGTVADVGQNADVVIITAGAAQKEGETRLHLLERNVAIFRRILADVAVYCPSALILVVSNPVDIMTYITLKITHFPPSRVIGSGTVLDSARLRSLLSTQLHVDARNVHAYIIGEHGDSELAVWSAANIGGARLLEGDWQDLSAADQESLTEIFLQVKNAAYEIIKRKGYTSYAIGLATTDIVKAILRSQERILTISTLLDGQYGLKDVCLSIPSVVNEKGVIKTLNLSLSPRETQQLHNSAKIMRDLIDQLKI